MKSSLVLKSCLILVAAFTLSACAKDSKKSAPEAAKPAASDVSGKEEKPVLTGLCSDEINQLLDAVTKYAETVANEKSRDNLVIIDKACERFKEKIGNTICIVEDQKIADRVGVTKESVKSICDTAASNLKSLDTEQKANPAAGQEKVEPKKEDVAAKTKPAVVEVKGEAKPAEPVKKDSIKVEAAKEEVAKRAKAEVEAAKAKEAAGAKDLVINHKNGLTLTVKRPEVLKEILPQMGSLQEGFARVESITVDAKKNSCVLDGTDSNAEFKADQVFEIKSITLEKTNLVLDNGVGMIAGKGRFLLTCKKASATPNPTDIWTMQDLKDALGEAISVSAK